MKANINRILALLLVGQIALIAFFYWPGRDMKPAATELVTDLAADTVRKLVITDDEAKTISLAKDDQGHWQVTAGSGPPLPADSKQMERTINALTSLESQRLVTRTPASHVRLQVDERVFSRKVTLGGAKDISRTLFLGTAPGQQNIHARTEGSNDVYLAKGISSWELNTDPDSWLAKEYVAVDRDKLMELHLKNQHGLLTLKKEGNTWQLIDENGALSPAAEEAVDSLLQRATRLTLHEYLGKEKPTQSLAAATLTLVTEAETVSIDIGGGKDKDNFHPVKSSASPYYVTVSDYQIKPLLEMKAESLKPAVQQEPNE